MPTSIKRFALATFVVCAIGCANGDPKPPSAPGVQAHWLADGYYLPAADVEEILNIADLDARREAFRSKATRLGPLWAVDPDSFTFLLKQTAAARRAQAGLPDR